MQIPNRSQTQFVLVSLSFFLAFSLIWAASPTSQTILAPQSTEKKPSSSNPPSGLTLLWDETGNPSGFATNSQNFEPSNDTLDDECADDFFVPAGQTWTIRQVKVDGTYAPGHMGPATSVNVVFYSNAATLPGAPVAGGSFQNVAMVDTSGNFAITLPSNVVLSAGTYWVSVQANMSASTAGRWNWNDNTLQMGAGAAWRNPGAGQMAGCMTWARRITCVSNPTGADQIFQLLGSVTGSTPTPTPSGTPQPTATPNGNDKIVYSNIPNDNFEIFVMDPDGSNQVNVTNNSADDVDPAWSPDGRKIVFASARDDGLTLEIYVMDRDGSNPVRLTNNMDDDFTPAWSPDGNKIVFTSMRDNNLEIYVMNADGSNQIRLTNNSVDDLSPVWSPDGMKIAFTTNRTGDYEIFVMDPDGGNPTNITNNAADDFTPAWSPDGTKISFESFRDNNFEIYKMDASGANQTRLTNSPTDDIYSTWSPDGTKIAFTSSRNGDYDIFVMNADGSNQTNITNNPIPEVNPDWGRLSTATPTPTPTATATSTPTVTATGTPTPTSTITPTASATATPTGTATVTPSATASVSPTPSNTPTPTATASATPSASSSPAQALNISTRLRVQTGNNVLIGGFIVTGTAPKTVVVRAVGPSLGALGIPDPLADPTLELHASSGALIMQNDNWQDDPTQAAQLTALGLGLTDIHESGLIASLQPGAYTAIVAGKDNGTGVGLVEVYDTDQAAASQLGNISTRGFVLTGSNVMIGGFILGGGSNTLIAVRGIGPSLSQFVSPVLADPTLELHDSNGEILAANDNWQDDAGSAAQLIDHGLALSDPNESGIVQSLPPGAFTAILAGNSGGTGIGLVEVYNLH